MNEENGTQPEALMLILPQEGLQRVANYLQQRPWAEVNELIGILLQAVPLTDQQTTPEPKRR